MLVNTAGRVREYTQVTHWAEIHARRLVDAVVTTVDANDRNSPMQNMLHRSLM